MRVLFLVFVMSALIGCSDDDSDSQSPTGPDNGTTGVIYGTVTVYDQQMRVSNDHSGAIVRYVNTEGRSFTDTSNTAGEWSLDLPLGTYYLDTIFHPSLLMLSMGNNPTYAGISPVDWLGRGRRQIITDTKFIPQTIDTIISITDLTVQETGAGLVTLIANYKIASWYNTVYKITAALTKPDGSTVVSTQSFTSLLDSNAVQMQSYLLTGLPPGTSVRGMTVTITISSIFKVEQMYSLGEGRYGVTYTNVTPRSSVASITL